MVKKKTNVKKMKNMKSCKDWKCGDAGSIYGLGFIGAAIYYLMHATGFWNGVLGILKAIVWPVFVVMKILGL